MRVRMGAYSGLAGRRTRWVASRGRFLRWRCVVLRGALYLQFHLLVGSAASRSSRVQPPEEVGRRRWHPSAVPGTGPSLRWRSSRRGMRSPGGCRPDLAVRSGGLNQTVTPGPHGQVRARWGGDHRRAGVTPRTTSTCLPGGRGRVVTDRLRHLRQRLLRPQVQRHPEPHRHVADGVGNQLLVQLERLRRSGPDPDAGDAVHRHADPHGRFAVRHVDDRDTVVADGQRFPCPGQVGLQQPVGHPGVADVVGRRERW